MQVTTQLKENTVTAELDETKPKRLAPKYHFQQANQLLNQGPLSQENTDTNE
jgi:hypothetical protein